MLCGYFTFKSPNPGSGCFRKKILHKINQIKDCFYVSFSIWYISGKYHVNQIIIIIRSDYILYNTHF